MTKNSVEIRCPNGFRKLFAKLKTDGLQPFVTNDNLLEFSCNDCKRELKKETPDIVFVLHRYNILGQFIESEIVRD